MSSFPCSKVCLPPARPVVCLPPYPFSLALSLSLALSVPFLLVVTAYVPLVPRVVHGTEYSSYEHQREPFHWPNLADSAWPSGAGSFGSNFYVFSFLFCFCVSFSVCTAFSHCARSVHLFLFACCISSPSVSGVVYIVWQLQLESRRSSCLPSPKICSLVWFQCVFFSLQVLYLRSSNRLLCDCFI